MKSDPPSPPCGIFHMFSSFIFISKWYRVFSRVSLCQAYRDGCVNTFKVNPGLPLWLSGKKSACQCRRHGFDPWSRKNSHAVEQLNPCAKNIKPVRPRNHSCWVHMQQLLEPTPQWRGHHNEKQKHHNEE